MLASIPSYEGPLMGASPGSIGMGVPSQLFGHDLGDLRPALSLLWACLLTHHTPQVPSPLCLVG